VSAQRGVDPDNVASPLVAGLGDVLSVALLGAFAELCHRFPVVAAVVMGLVLCAVPFCWARTRERSDTLDVLKTGWWPIALNLLLSFVSGSLIETDAHALTGGLAALVPVINGVGGNMAGVFSSRMSTELHLQEQNKQQRQRQRQSQRVLAEAANGTPQTQTLSRRKGSQIASAAGADATRTAANGNGTAVENNANERYRAQNFSIFPSLVVVNVCTEFVFLLVIRFFSGGSDSKLTFAFSCAYITATVGQVSVLVVLARWLNYYWWARGLDPDNHCMPYLAAISDFIGTSSIVLLSRLNL